MEYREAELGRVVLSKAGRDWGRYFIIVGIVDDHYVLVADGSLRKINKPKKKKLKHVSVQNELISTLRAKIIGGIPVTDVEIRNVLESIKKTEIIPTVRRS